MWIVRQLIRGLLQSFCGFFFPMGSNDFGSSFSSCFCLSCHGSLQLFRKPRIFSAKSTQWDDAMAAAAVITSVTFYLRWLLTRRVVWFFVCVFVCVDRKLLCRTHGTIYITSSFSIFFSPYWYFIATTTWEMMITTYVFFLNTPTNNSL